MRPRSPPPAPCETPRRRALGVVADAKRELPAGLPERQRAALELVADGVVERYS